MKLKFLQAAFTPIGRDGVDVWVAVVNMYTAPAYFMIAFALLTLIPLNTIFTEEYAGVLNDKKEGDENAISNILFLFCRSIQSNPEIRRHLGNGLHVPVVRSKHGDHHDRSVGFF